MRNTCPFQPCLLALLLPCCVDASAPDAPAADGGEPSLPSACRGSVDDLAVSRADAAGYASYALSGCSLVYVAVDGALRLRSIDSGDEAELAPAAERPTRPSIGGSDTQPDELIAWESERDGLVRVRFRGDTTSVRTSYARSGQPRASAGAVVFSAWVDESAGADADVLLYEAETGALSTVGEGAGQQLFPDVSATSIAYTDFAEDPDGRFDDDGNDAADIVMIDRVTRTRRVLELAGKQAFPLLMESERLVYLSWAAGTHPEPKLSSYALVAWDFDADTHTTLADIETQPPYVRPSTWGRTVEWIVRPIQGAERLMRRQVEPEAHAEIAFSEPALSLHASASSRNSTLLATLEPEQTSPTLRSVAR